MEILKNYLHTLFSDKRLNNAKYVTLEQEEEEYGKSLDINELSHPIQLKKELGLFSTIGALCSLMIGAGIFISPSHVLQRTGSVGLCLIIWAICGFLSFLGSLVFGELGTLIPQSGGEYSIYQASFSKLGSDKSFLGPLPAFLYCFISILLVRPSELATLILTSSEYVLSLLSHTIPGNRYYTKSLSLCGIGIMTLINSMSVRVYIKVINLFSSLKIIACLLVVLGGLFYLCTGHTENINKGFEGTKFSPKDIVLAINTGLWTFDGWGFLTEITEEIKSPRRNIPLSISIAVPSVTILFILMNVAYMSVLTVPDMISSQDVAVEFGNKLYPPLATVLTVAVVLSAFSCALSNQFGASRLCYASAKNGHMIEALSYIHTTRFTPMPAVIFQGLITALLIVNGEIIKLIEFVTYLIWFFYGLTMVAFFILRKTMADTHRLYKVPLIVPVIVLVNCIILTITPLVTSPAPQFTFALLAILVGIITYYVFVYKKLHPSCMGTFNEMVKKILNVAPPSA